MGELVDHPIEVQYFWPNMPVGFVQDDHVPFLNRGSYSHSHRQTYIYKHMHVVCIVYYVCMIRVYTSMKIHKHTHT